MNFDRDVGSSLFRLHASTAGKDQRSVRAELWRFPDGFGHRAMLLLLASFLLPPAISHGQTDDSALRSRFLQGIAAADQKLRGQSIRASCIFTRSATLDPAKPTVESRETFQCAILGSNAMMKGLSRHSGNVYFKVRNDTYAFMVEQTKVGKRTSLLFVEQLGADPVTDAKIGEYEVMTRAMALGRYYLWGHPLFQTFDNGTFKISKVSQINIEGSELVRVDFHGVVSEPTEDGTGIRPAYKYSDAFLICDPSNDWVMTEYGGDSYVYVNKGTGRHHVLLEIGKTFRGIPVATRIKRQVDFVDSHGNSESTVDIEFDEREINANEFLLGHYGLPEPNFQRARFGSWLWYLAGAVFFLGAGWMIRRRASARNQTP